MTFFDNFYKTYCKYAELKKPKSLSKSALKLSEECGEVAEAAFALLGNKKKIRKISVDNQTPEARMAEELGDVIIVALNIAIASGISHSYIFEYANGKMRDKIQRRLDKEK